MNADLVALELKLMRADVAVGKPVKAIRHGCSLESYHVAHVLNFVDVVLKVACWPLGVTAELPVHQACLKATWGVWQGQSGRTSWKLYRDAVSHLLWEI